MPIEHIIIIGFVALLTFISLLAVAVVALIVRQRRLLEHHIRQDERAKQTQQTLESLLTQTQQFPEQVSQIRETLIEKLLSNQLGGFKQVQESLQHGLAQFSQTINKQMEQLTQTTTHRLLSISQQVEQRLSDGFEKTQTTFTDVVKRLALIDQAQQKITELSNNVVSLQSLLNDKRSRGAFGEVQLVNLIRNMLPENSFSLQHTLSNEKRVDCLLLLPEPTGNIAIDAKFPLENYQQATKNGINDNERKQAEQLFRRDIRKHIQDIASKYILPDETADGAILFIPAESIFSDLHSHYPELIEFSHQSRVWLASPTTMMAILTTVKAVLKDSATRKQVHLLQKHLNDLAKDFDRFQQRMTHLAKHIDKAQQDVSDVNISANKIVSRFNKIEQLELEE